MWQTSSRAADSTGNRLPEDSRLNRQLVEAARDGDVEKVELLLDLGASPEAGQALGYTSLGLAVNRGHTEVVELLLRRGASPDTSICANDATPLMISVVWDRRDALAVLLQHRCSLELRGTSGSYRGCSALDVALQRGRTVAAEMIIHERARRRLQRLSRLVPTVGRVALALVELYTEVYWRPGGRGERQARLEFEGAIESSHTTADAFDTLALRTLSLE